MSPMTLDDCADYIIVKTSDDGASPSLLKLHKLVYYAQAWHLALHGTRLFSPGRFEAWVHGPVSRELYKRFASRKILYSAVTRDDIRPWFDINSLDPKERSHIDEVLEVYAGLTGAQLEQMTHEEDPWIRARGALSPSARCEIEIDEDLMTKYYAARVA
jgi:uncharacterized phage-associated protein